jgi:transposase
MQDQKLFVDCELPGIKAGPSAQQQPPRVCRPDRQQMHLRPCSLEELIPQQHQVRTLWNVVEQLDLSGFYASLQCRGSSAGRPATDPQLLVALLLWAATQGISSCREIDRLCQEHDAYKWLCGGVGMNYHTLSSFRTDHAQALEDLFINVLAMLICHGLVSVHRITQDGLRVRASAGLNSFKGQKGLEEALALATAQVEALKIQAEKESILPQDQQRSARERAAQERAARERQERVEQALATIPQLQEIKNHRHGKKKDQQEAKASISDPQARKMKMPDSGFRPAYNIQVVADTQSRAILAVDVTDQGTDQQQSEPLRQDVQRLAQRAQELCLAKQKQEEQQQQQSGQHSMQPDQVQQDQVQPEQSQQDQLQQMQSEQPQLQSSQQHSAGADQPQSPRFTVEEHLYDGGYINLSTIERSEKEGVKIYAPPKATTARPDPYTPVPGDSAELIAWRERMGTPQAKEIYQQRASTSETINADLRCHRSLEQFAVRGIDKVRCLALWSALAYNLMHFGKAILSLHA